MDPLEHVLYEGVLRDIPVGRLEEGETSDVSIPICFLSRGRFVLSATVRSSDTKTAEGVKRLTALVDGG